ncbi:MAG TPA: helix-turn-helix domain-containing protein [Propionibacteriaceae bacterium]|nr:helix-turn-helix domain-containing protein [Propionibacteriaceae bacterium]
MEVSEMVGLAQSVGDEDPRKALQATAQLKQAADQMEALVVRRARVRGMSWSEIAGYLGVSKQAVHKRYGRG